MARKKKTVAEETPKPATPTETPVADNQGPAPAATSEDKSPEAPKAPAPAKKAATPKTPETKTPETKTPEPSPKEPEKSPKELLKERIVSEGILVAVGDDGVHRVFEMKDTVDNRRKAYLLLTAVQGYRQELKFLNDEV